MLGAPAGALESSAVTIHRRAHGAGVVQRRADMTTLITGATGFVGINIIEALLARGEEVVAYGLGALPAAASAEFKRHGKQLHVVSGDLRDAASVAELFAGRRIDRMVHAAVITAGVDREKREPHTIVDVNVTGTARMLEAAHRHGVGRIVHVSSGSAYGRSLFERPRLHEQVTPDQPETMYQLTKFAGERTAMRLRTLWNLDLVCTRLGSVIGPWERDTGVRDTLSSHFQLARMALAGQDAILPQREYRKDWVYCRDVAAGIVAMLEAKSPSHNLYNLTSGFSWGGLARWCEHLKAVRPGFRFHVAADGETPNLNIAEKLDRGMMDIGRLTGDLGFHPAFDPDKAYEDYARWLVAHPDGGA